MYYLHGLLLGFVAADYETVNSLVHETRLIRGKRVRLFSMSQALAVLQGYMDARRYMGIYSM